MVFLTGGPGSPIPWGPGGPGCPCTPTSPYGKWQCNECQNRVIYWWITCFHNVNFLNNTTVCFTLGPGRPIPVSPCIPGGPGSPLSPYKNKHTCKAQTPYFITDLCIFSLCCICSLVPPTPHLNTCFSYMQSLTIFKEALNMYYGILSLLQTRFYW